MGFCRLRTPVAVFAVGGALLTAAPAETIPRYSARYEQDCNLCHVNPAGGGQRTTYATKFIVPKEMALLSLDDEALEAIDPELSRSVTVGADLRTMFFSSNLSDEDRLTVRNAPPENFFQMQGNLYVSFQMTDRVAAHFSKGLSTTTEIYGLAYLLPANGYVKIGRFAPNFGWRVPDHTAFVRDFLGFFPPTHTDVGVEVGLHPGRLALSASVLNGQLGSTRDFDDEVAVTGRGLARGNLGGVGLALGGSVWWNDSPAGERLAGGPLAYIHWSPLTWIGELDFSEDTVDTVSVTSIFTSHELSVRLRQGIDLKGTFDLYDPNVDGPSGKQLRYGIGGEVMPYPFVRLEALVYFYRTPESGIDLSQPEYTQLVGQVHFFY